jgi:hypothetical protein
MLHRDALTQARAVLGSRAAMVRVLIKLASWSLVPSTRDIIFAQDVVTVSVPHARRFFRCQESKIADLPHSG